MTNNNNELIDELGNCRSVISELIDKCWEMGGYSVGEKEFEKYSFIKDAREELESIEKLLKENK